MMEKNRDIDRLWLTIRSILTEYRMFGLGSVTAWGIKLYPGKGEVLDSYSIQQIRYVLGEMKRDGIVESTPCWTNKGRVNAYSFREITKEEV